MSTAAAAQALRSWSNCSFAGLAAGAVTGVGILQQQGDSAPSCTSGDTRSHKLHKLQSNLIFLKTQHSMGIFLNPHGMTRFKKRVLKIEAGSEAMWEEQNSNPKFGQIVLCIAS